VTHHDPIPEWFARIIDDRFSLLEKRQAEHALDMQRRQDALEDETRRRMDSIEKSQQHLDECLDETKNAIADDRLHRATERGVEAELREREGKKRAEEEARRDVRLTHVERILFGAAALLLTAAILMVGDRIMSKPYETPRTYEYPTTPYKGAPPR
jgi:hypothetical protein